jgi:hypothetical protein
MNVLVDLNEKREALTGTRSMVENERFTALLAALIDAEVLSAAEVAGMCERLADRLEGHARGAIGRLTSVPELLDAAMRARNVARMCREVRCG